MIKKIIEKLLYLQKIHNIRLFYFRLKCNLVIRAVIREQKLKMLVQTKRMIIKIIKKLLYHDIISLNSDQNAIQVIIKVATRKKIRKN